MKNKIILLLSAIVVALSGWLFYEIQHTGKTTIRVDTVQTVTKDTVYATDTVYTEKFVVGDPDTVYVGEDTQEDNKYSYYRNYTTTHTDTLLDATIKTTVQGFLVSQTLNYTPNYPIQVNTTFENTVTRTITKYPDLKGSPLLVTGISTNSLETGVHLGLGWRFKSNNSLYATYDPILKRASVSYSYNLRNLFK